MAKCGQVLYALPNSVMIIDAQHANIGPLWRHIYKDQRHRAILQLAKERFFCTKGHDSDTLDIAFRHPPNTALHPLRVVIERADQEVVSILEGDLFEALNQLQEKWVCNLRDDESKKPATTGNKSACLRIGQIVEFPDRLPYPFRHRWVDIRDVIHGS
jgi:hypothetical protein